MDTPRSTLPGRTLLVAVAAVAVMLLLAGITPAGAANTNDRPAARGTIADLYADLAISAESIPEPVNAGNFVLLEHTITNAGPDYAEGVNAQGYTGSNDDVELAIVDIDLEFEGGKGERTTRRGEFEPCGTEGLSWWCDIGFLGTGEAAIVKVTALAPGVSETTVLSNHAEVYAASIDEDPLDDQVDFDTTVEPEDPDSDSGFIPPGGGTLTTDPGTGATETDTTVITLKVPAGPGGPASVNEEECDAADDLFPCIGNIGNFVPPDGYDKMIAEFVYDRSITRGGLRNNRREWKVFYQKAPGEPVLELPRCTDTVPKNTPPCLKKMKRLDVDNPLSEAHRDLLIRVLIDSDPRMSTRK
jgi:hypothetical protein